MMSPQAVIIIVALAAVTAVFVLTSLSAGLFSIGETAGNAGGELELAGDVTAVDTQDTAGVVEILIFTGSITAGADPIDFTAPTDLDADGLADPDSANRVMVNIIGDEWQVNNLYWAKLERGESDGDDFLEEREVFRITIGNADGSGDLEDVLGGDGLRASETFTIQVVPPGRTNLVIERTLPPVIAGAMNLG